jgi:flavodoxin/ferredoxin
LKTLIITFSQTGYTRKTAEHIQEGILAVTDHCDLADLADVESGLLANYDLVGIGCPVFYYQEPFHVRDFVDQLPEQKGRHWFVFCSHGSAVGITLPSLSGHLKKSGAHVVGYFDIYADACAPFIPYPTFTTGHPDKSDYETARAFGREVAERTERFLAGERPPVPEPRPPEDEWARSARMFTPEVIERVVPPLSINSEKCTFCGECEENCPVKGIDAQADPPRIQDPCIYCFRCVMVCPALAIEADWTVMVANNPAHYARLRKWLDEAAARGEFRWRMDPDSIDFDDTMHKQRERALEANTEEDNEHD